MARLEAISVSRRAQFRRVIYRCTECPQNFGDPELQPPAVSIAVWKQAIRAHVAVHHPEKWREHSALPGQSITEVNDLLVATYLHR